MEKTLIKFMIIVKKNKAMYRSDGSEVRREKALPTLSVLTRREVEHRKLNEDVKPL